MEILLVLRLTQTKVGDIIDIKVYTDPGWSIIDIKVYTDPGWKYWY